METQLEKINFYFAELKKLAEKNPEKAFSKDFYELWEKIHQPLPFIIKEQDLQILSGKIRLSKNQQNHVCYFKWDGIDQYGCDSPLHDHGDESHTAQERRDCYAYEMGRRLIQIVEQVSEQRPDVIVGQLIRLWILPWRDHRQQPCDPFLGVEGVVSELDQRVHLPLRPLLSRHRQPRIRMR